MALEVVGAGFGRTGTKSLKFALEMLGFDRCYHMMEVREHLEHRPIWSAAHRGKQVDWDALFEGYRASVDWPACNMWRELSEYYPQSKVILTTRDPESWYDSIHNTIYASSTQALHSEDEDQRLRGQWVNEVIWQWQFDGRMDDKDYVIRVFNDHIARVKATIPAERLLVFEASQGWPPLCEFLGRPVPQAPFPNINTTEEFRGRYGWDRVGEPD